MAFYKVGKRVVTTTEKERADGWHVLWVLFQVDSKGNLEQVDAYIESRAYPSKASAKAAGFQVGVDAARKRQNNMDLNWEEFEVVLGPVITH